MERKGGSDQQRSTFDARARVRPVRQSHVYLLLVRSSLWLLTFGSSISSDDQASDKARKTDGSKNLKPDDGKTPRFPAPLLYA
jgi:hypothetical protein